MPYVTAGAGVDVGTAVAVGGGAGVGTAVAVGKGMGVDVGTAVEVGADVGTGVRVDDGSDVADGMTAGAGASVGEGVAGGADVADGAGADVEVGAMVGDETGVEVGAGVDVSVGADVGVADAGEMVGEGTAGVSIRRTTSGAGAASSEGWLEQATNSPATAIAAASFTAHASTPIHDSIFISVASQRSESPSILAKLGQSVRRIDLWASRFYTLANLARARRA